MGQPSNIAKLRGGAHDSRTQDNVGEVLDPLARAVGNTPIMGAPPPAWIKPDLKNGYSQTAAPQPVVAYHKDALGYVHTKLSLTHAAGTGGGTLAFTYEAGCRPSETLTFTLSNAAGAAAVVTVDASGQLANIAAIGAGATLRGCFNFLAEQ